MAKTKLPILKPVLGVAGMSDNDLLSRLNAVHEKMLNNPAYPSPPVDMAGFKSAIDAFTAAGAAPLEGGKAAAVARGKRRIDAIDMFRQIRHYVAGAGKNNMAALVSNGL